jgi:predicted aspartyl protease
MRPPKLLALACLVAILPAQVSGAADDPLPSAGQIAARVREATGSLPPSERISIRFVHGTLDGTRIAVRRGSDWRETTREGPFVSDSGALRTYGWRQNENGITVVDTGAYESDFASPAISSGAVVTLSADSREYVLSMLNESGFGWKTYVERATWRVVRQEYVGKTQRTVKRYEDFRRLGARERPWHYVSDDGRPEDRYEETVISDTSDPVREEEVLVPEDRRMLVEFPTGGQPVVLPARFERDRIIVRATIGQRGYDLLLDTGASGIELDADAIKQLALPSYGRQLFAGVGGTVAGSRTIVPEIRVGELRLRDVVVGTMPPIERERGVTTGSIYAESTAKVAIRITGLLGFDFIAGTVLKIDYDRHSVNAISPAAFKSPPGAFDIPVRLGSGTPKVDVRINGALGENFLIDTGAMGALLVYERFARDNPEAMQDLRGGGVERLGTLSGIGGYVATEPLQLDTVSIGSITFKKFVAYRATSTSLSANLDGLIGTDFLRFFDLYTDYANSRVILVPNAAGRAAYKLPKS